MTLATAINKADGFSYGVVSVPMTVIDRCKRAVVLCQHTECNARTTLAGQ